MPKLDMTRKPVYKGERVDRTSVLKEIILCHHCSRFATHRARLNKFETTPVDLYLCNDHTTQSIKDDEVHMVKELPEYRLYSGRLRKWQALQNAGEQEGLFQ